MLDESGTVKDIQFILGHSENNPISAFSYLRLNLKNNNYFINLTQILKIL